MYLIYLNCNNTGSLKKLNPKNLSFRTLIYPENMTLQVLPQPYKKLARDSINQHIVWLESISGATPLAEIWRDVLQYMNAKDQSHLLKEFFRLNDDKDGIRNERFEDVFPEYKELRNFI